MRGILFAAIAVALLLLAGTAAVESAFRTSGVDRVVVENESWSPDPGNWTELEDSNLDPAEYDPTVLVTNNNDKVMAIEEDYLWNRSTGEVKAVEGGRLDGENTAYITYGYTAPSRNQEQMLQVWDGMSGSLGPGLLILIMVGLVLAAGSRLARA